MCFCPLFCTRVPVFIPYVGCFALCLLRSKGKRATCWKKNIIFLKIQRRTPQVTVKCLIKIVEIYDKVREALDIIVLNQINRGEGHLSNQIYFNSKQ